MLHDLLSVATVEPLCEDNDVVRVLKPNLNPTARILVEEIERHRQGVAESRICPIDEADQRVDLQKVPLSPEP